MDQDVVQKSAAITACLDRNSLVKESSILTSYVEKNSRFTYNDLLSEIPLLGLDGEPGNSLFISSKKISHDHRLLVKNNIKTVISVCENKKKQRILDNYAAHGISNYHFAIDDCESENISEIFPETDPLIEESLKKGGVLVHCRAGISRSATVVLEYLLYSKKFLDLKSAVDHLLEIRPEICPNPAFIRQLLEYQ